jgi:hypothetical protein
MSPVKQIAIIGSLTALLLALLYGAWVRANKESRAREAFAEEMTQEADEQIDFYAAGILNHQLVIVPEHADHAPGGQVDCDAIIDGLVLDKRTLAALQRKGFRSLRCGTRELSS